MRIGPTGTPLIATYQPLVADESSISSDAVLSGGPS